MDDNYENWMQLAAQIIIEVIEDYRNSRDHYQRVSLIKWFDTSYGITICDLAGMNSEYIKREVQYIDKQEHIRNDNKGIKKVYPATGKESKYQVKGYNLQKKPNKKRDLQSDAGGDRLLEAFRYYKQAGKSCDWLPVSTKI